MIRAPSQLRLGGWNPNGEVDIPPRLLNFYSLATTSLLASPRCKIKNLWAVVTDGNKREQTVNPRYYRFSIHAVHTGGDSAYGELSDVVWMESATKMAENQAATENKPQGKHTRKVYYQARPLYRTVNNDPQLADQKKGIPRQKGRLPLADALVYVRPSRPLRMGTEYEITVTDERLPADSPGKTLELFPSTPSPTKMQTLTAPTSNRSTLSDPADDRGEVSVAICVLRAFLVRQRTSPCTSSAFPSRDCEFVKIVLSRWTTRLRPSTLV